MQVSEENVVDIAVKQRDYIENFPTGRRVISLELKGTLGETNVTTSFGISRRVVNHLRDISNTHRQRLLQGLPGNIDVDVFGITVSDGILKRVFPTASIYYAYHPNDPEDLKEWFDSVSVIISSPTIEYL